MIKLCTDRRGAVLTPLLIVAIVCGCGTTTKARLTAWRAAQYDVGGIERLAVWDFRAPTEVAAIAEDTAVQQLQQSGFYQVVRAAKGRQYEAAHVPLPTDADGLRQIVARGREVRADAVLVGRVRKRLDQGTQLGNLTIRVGEPELAVMIEYYVVDMHSRTVRARQQIVRTRSNEAFADDKTQTARTVDTLVRQCAEEMVSQITAGSELVEVELARVTMGKGSGYIQDGNKLAGEGKWPEAAEEYLSAVNVNPDCHQAIYNLGLAAEAQGRFAEAEKMYHKAITKSDERLYQDALARVANTGQTYHLARRQIAHRPRWRARPDVRLGSQHPGRPPRQAMRNSDGPFTNVNSRGRNPQQ